MAFFSLFRYDSQLKEELCGDNNPANSFRFLPTMQFVENYLQNIANSKDGGFMDPAQNKLTYEVCFYLVIQFLHFLSRENVKITHGYLHLPLRNAFAVCDYVCQMRL